MADRFAPSRAHNVDFSRSRINRLGLPCAETVLEVVRTPNTRKHSTLKPALASVALAACLLVLAACGPTSEPVNEPKLVTASAWWETLPATQLNLYSYVELEATFRNVTGGELEFWGETTGHQPADDIQIWTAPGIVDPPVTFNEFPQGRYAPDATITWNLTIHLSTLNDAENQIAIRPVSVSQGTLAPTQLQLANATVDWVK